MNNALKYGGPDDQGIFISDQVVLTHCRLSILDLSPAGHQPMQWQNYTIVYNGEIYNFREIQKELVEQGYSFETGSDTEVILKSFKKWGKNCVHRFRGMFVFALWDEQNKKLLLCRDRVGVKPLYWYQKDDLFMFSSELKSFHKHPGFDKTIDKEAISLFLQQGYIHSPYCVFKYVKKLEPGYFLEVDSKGSVSKECYWSAQSAYQNNNRPFKGKQPIVEKVEKTLLESFKLRMVSDVPIGMFLSGGIDSSLVTAMLQKETNTRLKTFTIGFEDKKFNEAGHAKKIAEYLGTEHEELICKESDFESVLDNWAEIYDEPFGDSSGIPTHLVAKLARRQVKVSLSADGGDELFGGYTKHSITKKMQPFIQDCPLILKKTMAASAKAINPEILDIVGSNLPFLRKFTNVGHKFYKARNALSADDITSFFNHSSVYVNRTQLKALYPYFINRFDTRVEPSSESLISYLGMIDIQTYLEGDIMAKVDRATMQVALEGREPFLDHHIIELALALPDEYKIRNGKGKYILREILKKYIPQEMIDRPKQGFAVPIEKWLKGRLSDELQEIPNDKNFIETFEFCKTELSRLISSFLNNKEYVNGYYIWFIFVLHNWYVRWLKNTA